MMSFQLNDLELLYNHALNSNLIVETGGGGKSTIYLAKAAEHSGAHMVTIEERPSRLNNRISHVDYKVGWSVAYSDLIKKGHALFLDLPTAHRRKRYRWSDRKVSMHGEKFMKGETDLIRKVVQEYGQPIDFFFCDTGEYCGLAEWNVARGMIPLHGKFACHDIYYPKSIKCFQVAKHIEENSDWNVLVKTSSKQGLLIAEKIQ